MSRHLGMYRDIKRAFDTCLIQGKITLAFPTGGKASHWRMRAYYYRKLLHEKQAIDFGEAIGSTQTEYDSIRMKIDKENPTRVELEEMPLEATILDAEGNEIALAEDFTKPESGAVPELNLDAVPDSDAIERAMKELDK